MAVMKFTKKSYTELVKIVGRDRVSIEKEDLACYAFDAKEKADLPSAVVMPESAGEVAQILKLANEQEFYVIPRGAGTGLTGGAAPVMGGLVMAMAKFNRILEIDTDNLIAVVEPGVITGNFHREVEKVGLFYPPDPASSDFSTLGGNLAECAGGPRAVKYGVTRDYVLGLEAVLPTGEIIKTGVRTAKGVAGYDLTRLLVGSEGTLGVFTKATLKLLPLPEGQATMSAVFSSIDHAAESVSAIIRNNIIPRTIEFLDNASIRCAASCRDIGVPLDADAMLIIDVDGKGTVAETEIARIVEILQDNHVTDIRTAKTREEADELWAARKLISPGLHRFGPNKLNEDIVVPRSKIPDMIRRVQEISQKINIPIICFGHAGDGNIHVNIMYDKKDKQLIEKTEKAIEEIFEFTIHLGGTITGEHGVGTTKSSYLSMEIGAMELGLMKKIKHLFDPKGILNPGKIFV